MPLTKQQLINKKKDLEAWLKDNSPKHPLWNLTYKKLQTIRNDLANQNYAFQTNRFTHRVSKR